MDHPDRRSIATFMLLLDVTVVNVALPGIQTDLGACFDELRWAIHAHALTLAATMLIFGSISDRVGRRRVLTIGLAAVSLARDPQLPRRRHAPTRARRGARAYG